MSNNIHLLVNTASRQGRIALPQIISALERHGMKPDKVHALKPGNDLGKTCRKIISKKPSLVIIGGGDGTVSHALGLFANSKIDLAVVPLGTTNNFARSLDLPLTIDGAVERLVKSKAKPVDLGVVNGEYFANVIGIGLSASIAKHVTHKIKQRYGRAAYAIVGLQQLLKHKPFIASVHDKDHEFSFSFATRQMIIANGRYHAGRQIAADVHLDNDELVIFALGGQSRISFFWHMLDFYIGKRKKIVYSTYAIGNNIKIETSTPQLIEVDGETSQRTPLAAHIAPKAVRVRH